MFINEKVTLLFHIIYFLFFYYNKCSRCLPFDSTHAWICRIMDCR